MKKSFTLIELLVTIGIMTIVTAASVAGLKGYKSRTYFNDAVSQVHGEVLKAQSLALAPSKVDIESYTLTITTSDGTYNIKDNNGDELDSGRFGDKVTVSGTLSITFNKDGSASPGGTIIISDTNTQSGFNPKKIIVTAAGSVELK